MRIFQICVFRKLRIAIAGLICGLLFTVATEAQTAQTGRASDVGEIRQLIAGLADDDFQTRQESGQRLKAIGAKAIEELEKFRHAGDSELRLSVIRLIVELRRDHLALQIRRFLNDETTLPGWQTYSEICGSDHGQRELFVELYRTQNDFFRKYDRTEKSQEEENQLLTDLLAQLRESSSSSTSPDQHLIACVSLQVIKTFSSRRSDELSESVTGVRNQLQQNVGNRFKRTPFAVAWNSDKFRTLHREAVVRWMTFADSNIKSLRLRLEVGVKFSVPEAIFPAVYCLKHGKSFDSNARQLAMMIISVHGDESYIDLLSQYLDDSMIACRDIRKVGDQTTTYTTQTGDIALAAMVFLAGKEFSEFGFANLGAHEASQPLTKKQSGFSSDEARRMSRVEWNEFLARENAKHPSQHTNPHDFHGQKRDETKSVVSM